ncbi:MAG: translation elongation factor Ts [Desulfobulbaceae bacterium]|nr:translation elongation factor Ts [Desulfobulbaceae bacterium]
MAEITAKAVNELRKQTGVGMMECKKALTEAGGDIEKANTLMRERGLATAAKKPDRTTSQGLIVSYIHMDKLGVMVEVNCETDFVAKTDDFQTLCKDIAMHIAASSPVAIKREEIPADLVARETEIFKNQAIESGKPEKILDKIVSGKIDKYFSEVSLMEQKFVKNPDLTIQDLLNEIIAKIGENISIKRFARFQVGA